MSAHKISFSRRAVQAGVLLASSLAPLMASAQFALVSQTASVSASAYQASPVSQSSPVGTTESLALQVVTGTASVVTSNAMAGTIVESGRMGVSAEVGGSAFLSFPGCRNYDECGSPSNASSIASVSLYFDVLQPTAAVVEVGSHNSAYVGGTTSFPFPFEKQADNGNWLTVAGLTQAVVFEDIHGALNIFSGVLELDPGHYRMSANYSGNYDFGRSPSWGGAAISITAVPEPASWALMALGLAGLGVVSRRGLRQAA
jgi:hypothetical protein